MHITRYIIIDNELLRRNSGIALLFLQFFLLLSHCGEFDLSKHPHRSVHDCFCKKLSILVKCREEVNRSTHRDDFLKFYIVLFPGL